MIDLHQVNWTELPEPIDDGGTDHLLGATLPPVALQSTSGSLVLLSLLKGRGIVYAYPLTGRPDRPLPTEWDLIPGARGCTPQACAFRDHAAELAELGVDWIFGLSTQDTEYQREASARLHLPFPLLSDHELHLTQSLGLPTFEVEGMTLLKRFTAVVEDGTIVRIFYPVFPPDAAAKRVIEWLQHGA